MLTRTVVAPPSTVTPSGRTRGASVFTPPRAPATPISILSRPARGRGAVRAPGGHRAEPDGAGGRRPAGDLDLRIQRLDPHRHGERRTVRRRHQTVQVD